MSKRVRICYEVVTPESAAEGDAAERGWIDEEGIDVTPSADDVAEHDGPVDALVNLTLEAIGHTSLVPSSGCWHPGLWYTDADPERDCFTGAETRQSYHLAGFTPDEEAAVYRRLREVMA